MRMEGPLNFAEIACIFEFVLDTGKLANEDTFLLCLVLGYIVIGLPGKTPILLWLNGILSLLLSLYVWLVASFLHLDLSLHLVDDLIDFMSFQLGDVSLWWQGEEGFDYCFALAHEIDQFSVVISVLLPDGIGDDLI